MLEPGRRLLSPAQPGSRPVASPSPQLHSKSTGTLKGKIHPVLPKYRNLLLQPAWARRREGVSGKSRTSDFTIWSHSRSAPEAERNVTHGWATSSTVKTKEGAVIRALPSAWRGEKSSAVVDCGLSVPGLPVSRHSAVSLCSCSIRRCSLPPFPLLALQLLWPIGDKVTVASSKPRPPETLSTSVPLLELTWTMRTCTAGC